jgi:hypothetical protein
MTRTNLFAGILACTIGLAVVLGCDRFTSSNSANSTAKGNTNAVNNSAPNAVPSNVASSKPESKVEPADFTVTAEQLDKEFTRKGVKEEELEKYKNKNIAVTGRVSMLVKEKKGTTQPWVTLYAPGTLHGVNCYFDDADVGQMSKLEEDKMAKVQGFQDDFLTPEISPMLKHCKVLE